MRLRRLDTSHESEWRFSRLFASLFLLLALSYLRLFVVHDIAFDVSLLSAAVTVVNKPYICFLSWKNLSLYSH